MGDVGSGWCGITGGGIGGCEVGGGSNDGRAAGGGTGGGIGGCEVFYSNPANREYWSANSELNRLQAHFGMGAGNRSKLQAHVQEESDPFLEFMERQKNLTN